MIPLQFALRRRMMQSNEKTWTVTIQNNAAGNASPYYPKINGIASGPGTYKVRDGDVITLYGHVGAYETYYVEVIYIDGKVWHANYPETISQQHIVQTNCNIVISSSFSQGYTYRTRLTTT